MGRATRQTTDRATSGRRAALRTGPPGRGQRCTLDQLQRHRASGPSDQRTDDADTYQLTFWPRASGVYRLQPDSCNVRWDYAPGVRLGLLESTTHRWTGQLGPRLFRRILREKCRRAVGTHARIQQARFSLCHRRDGRAGNTILPTNLCIRRPDHLISDCWPARLLEQGQRRRTSCRDALRADSDTTGLIQPMPSERLQSWHYNTPN
jgi:hypothetical protein